MILTKRQQSLFRGNGSGVGTLSARETADAVITALTPAAWYRNATDVVSSGGFASIWADYASSDKGLVLPGVAGNCAVTPDAAANDFSAENTIDFMVKVAMTDWTPTTTQSLVCKWDTSGWLFTLLSTGRLNWVGDGATNITSTASVSASDGDTVWVRVKFTADNGAGGRATEFFQSSNGVDWTQIGTTVTTATATAISERATQMTIGAYAAALTTPTTGTVYRVKLYKGFSDSGGTLVFDADFSSQSIGAASFTESSSNAATVTINTSGAAPAHIGKARDLLQGTGTNQPAYAAGVFLFDGADNYMKITADAAIIQPVTLYLVANPVSWTVNDRIFDGNTTSSGAMRQDTATPQVDILNTTGNLPNNSDWTVGAYGIVCVVFNEASSVIRVNNAADVTGTVGADNMGGFTLGSTGAGSLFSNIAAKECVLFLAAHNDATRTSVITALNNALTVF